MKITELKPFGVEVSAAESGVDLCDVGISRIQSWIARHRVLVLRGFQLKTDADMLSFCSELGDILQWEFGEINELQVKSDTPSYLYTTHAVPFHWDGAFAGRIPHYIFFHCADAPATACGGETMFCNTVDLLDSIAAAEREVWSNIRVTYTTEKLVHYGGSFTSPLIDSHPVSGEPVIRFAEPVEDLNPVQLFIEGLPERQHSVFLSRMQNLLADPDYCFDHVWKTEDIVIADNHALLHGRRAFSETADRHLRRVNVM